jgi:hypothetical protein
MKEIYSRDKKVGANVQRFYEIKLRAGAFDCQQNRSPPVHASVVACRRILDLGCCHGCYFWTDFGEHEQDSRALSRLSALLACDTLNVLFGVIQLTPWAIVLRYDSSQICMSTTQLAACRS